MSDAPDTVFSTPHLHRHNQYQTPALVRRSVSAITDSLVNTFPTRFRLAATFLHPHEFIFLVEIADE
jgi:hypothetical protein